MAHTHTMHVGKGEQIATPADPWIHHPRARCQHCIRARAGLQYKNNFLFLLPKRIQC